MKFSFRQFILFTVIFLGTLIFFKSEAFAKDSCSCIANPMTKQYQNYSKHFWGNHRAWSCVYTCYVPGEGKVEVEGFHEKYYFSQKDNGSEGICDGIPLDYVYNNYVGWYIYMPKEPRHFDPLRSNSKNLKAWAKETCR